MKRLMAVIAFVSLSTGCGSGSPTAAAPIPSVPAQSLPAGGPALVKAIDIVNGQRIEASVQGDDPDCFPNWDASGRCRTFSLTAPSDGTLAVTLTVARPSRGMYDPELFLVAPDGSWLYAGEGWPERHLEGPAKSGLKYHIVVICYGPFPDAFVLTVGLK